MNYYLAKVAIGINGNFNVLIKAETLDKAFKILEREYSKEDGYSTDMMRTLE